MENVSEPLDLPKRTRFISGAYYWRPSLSLRLKGFRAMPLGKDRDRAIRAADGINDSTDRLLALPAATALGEMAAAYQRAYSGARKRAAEHGREFLLTPADLAWLIERSGGACEVSGIRFDLSAQEGRRRTPFAPSLDRIDAKAGYLPGNIRLVCVCVNIMISDFGDELFLRVCREVSRRANKMQA